MPTVSPLPDPVADARFYEGVVARRAAAFAIDAALAALTALATVLVFGIVTLGVGLALGLPIALTVSFLYRFLSLARWSATPGMLLFGVEARGRGGAHLTDAEALAHTGSFVLAFHLVAPQALSVALMATRRDGRGLHDLATGVTVINAPAALPDEQAGGAPVR